MRLGWIVGISFSLKIKDKDKYKKKHLIYATEKEQSEEKYLAERSSPQS